MSSDQDLAELLGQAPKTPDPVFRLDVFARIGQRTRMRAARRQATLYMIVSTAIGLVCAGAQAAGLTLEDVQPLLIAAAAVAGAHVFAGLAVRGPAFVLTHARTGWRLLGQAPLSRRLARL